MILVKNYFIAENISNLEDSTLLDEFQFYKNQTLELLKSHYELNDHNKIDSVFKLLEDEVDITLGLIDDNFIFHSILPGIISNTNADTTRGDTLIWEFTVKDFMNSDYQYTASSVIEYPQRKILVVLLVIFLGLCFLVYHFKHRNKN